MLAYCTDTLPTGALLASMPKANLPMKGKAEPPVLPLNTRAAAWPATHAATTASAPRLLAAISRNYYAESGTQLYLSH